MVQKYVSENTQLWKILSMILIITNTVQQEAKLLLF